MGGRWLSACEEDEHHELPIRTLRFRTKTEADEAIRIYFPERYVDFTLHGVESVRAMYEPVDRKLLN